MKFSDAKGRQVVSTTTADTVGKVAEFVVDPSSRSVVAVQLRKADNGDTLRWPDITAFGTDAVTVSGDDKISPADDEILALTGKDHLVVGKRVLSDAGDELGQVSDVEFDAGSGAVTQLLLGSGEVAGKRLIGVGSWAVVVRAEQE